MSEFIVQMVQIEKIVKHPNADSLSICEVDGCPVIIKTTDFKEGDYGIYIPVEAMVPTEPKYFNFLCDPQHPKTIVRIKAKKLRGIFSMGLLIQIPSGLGKIELGQDLSKRLGITKWIEPEPGVQGKPKEKAPWYKIALAWCKHPVRMFKYQILYPGGEVKDPGFMPVYDMESLRKYRYVLQPKELVYVSEKIHGCNARYCFKNGKFYVGSHKSFKKKNPDSWWWKMAWKYDLENKLKKYPGIALYGEIYGKNVQDLNYGSPQELQMRTFDFYDTNRKCFLDYTEFKKLADELLVPRVPELYVGPYSPEVVDPLADGKTTVPGATNIREGFVVKPVVERRAHVGRVIFKLVSETYLLRKNGTERQ